MPNFLYGTLGMDKRLRDVVFAGSHDAGITSGGWNAKTQNQNIYEQANSGVRLFDLRIHACKVKKHWWSRQSKAKLMAYHGKVTQSNHSYEMEATGNTESVVRSTMRLGTWGLGLEGMLQQAAQFVGEYSTEFLILKFDKCSNWSLIADYCIEFLGDRMYQGTGDLNRKTLQELKGKVIIVFSEKGFKATGHLTYYSVRGIKKWRNLYDKESGPSAYDSNFDGLQYFGKGGTTLNPFKNKLSANIKKQGKLMQQMASVNGTMAHSSNILGMMYWTTTGLVANIKTRNANMWTPKNTKKLNDLWEGGLYNSMLVRSDNQRIKRTNYASGSQMKAFIPNIIMIDFANNERCRVVFDLNNIATTVLTDMLTESEG